jgi:hypothetical protein
MKNYRSLVMPAMLLECAAEPCAANAKERAIAWLSTVSRFRCNSVVNSASSAPTQDKSVGTSAEWPSDLELPVKKKTAPKSGQFLWFARMLLC